MRVKFKNLTVKVMKTEGNEVIEGIEIRAACSGNSSSNVADEESENPSGRRETHPPTWMRDYVSGEGLSEGENELNMALVASADPLNFEEAVKSSKWRLAMEAEIRAIEKNKTWSLT